MSIRILITDDHTILRQGLRRILSEAPDFEVVGEASSGAQAIERAVELKPDVAIMDIAMKDLNGIEATRQLNRLVPNTAVLVLSMYDDEPYVIRATKAGARGYLLKNSIEDDLLKAVRTVHAGQTFFSPSITKILMESYHRNLNGKEVEDRYELLTPRERQIYQALAERMSNKEVAFQYSLSVHTVETHRIRIMEKMNLHSAAELVLSAVRRGLVR